MPPPALPLDPPLQSLYTRAYSKRAVQPICAVSKMQFVQSKVRNCAVQKHKVEDIIVQFSIIISVSRRTKTNPDYLKLNHTI